MGQTFGNVASGTWTRIRNNRNRSIASWVDEESGQSIFFEFRRNGRIKMYSDQDGNGKFNRKKDALIGRASFSRDFDKEHYGRSHFKKMKKGYFEVEVEGWTNDDGQYEAFYDVRLDSGVDYENRFGSTFDRNKFLDVTDHGLMTSIFQPDVSLV